MTHQFTVSPDFTPEHLSGWHIFNTWLQKRLDIGIHLEMYNSFDEQRAAIQSDNVDIIYANPYDASMLAREKGFVPVAKPKGKNDEAIVCVSAESDYQAIEDLKPGVTIATTDDPDVKLMGMIMLEPADINTENCTMHTCDSYVVIAKEMMQGQADVGLFLDEAYNDLSSIVKKQLRPLVTSQIFIIHHIMMVGPKLADKQAEISEALTTMMQTEKGPGVLESLGLQDWEAVSDEDMEFMIDIMSALE